VDASATQSIETHPHKYCSIAAYLCIVHVLLLLQPHFDADAKKGLSPASVWTEIQSTLKGSLQAVHSKLLGKQWLVDEYVGLSKL